MWRSIALSLLLLACDGGEAPTDAGPDPVDAPPPPPPPIVETTNGPVRGRIDVGYREFMGIPFAAPPVDALRWSPPQPPEPWIEPRDSRRPQRCVQDALGLGLASSEDCLYLNVHTPDPAPVDAPVMVWMFGGAFLFGEGVQTDEGTRGDVLAQQGVVVVSMNYRVGPFGFLAHPELSAEQGGSSGNYGMMDQRAALEWVRDNIAAFGGDPDNVTIFGESAGGLSACLHMVSAQSRGLFHRVISQSGLCDSVLLTLAATEATGVSLGETVGCSGSGALACMRAASADAVQEASAAPLSVLAELSRERRYWANIDGAFLQRDFREAVEVGEIADVPAVIGWNRDEGTLFLLLADTAGETIDASVYDTVVRALADRHGVLADDVFAAYPLSAYPDPSDAIAELLGHATLACPSRRAARLLAEHATSDVYVYRFDYPDAGFQLPSDRTLGAFHSAEVQFVFGHPSRIGQRDFRGDDLELSRAMSAYWARFARASDPNADGAPAWPVYDLASDEHIVLDRVVASNSRANADDCVLWDAGR